MSLVSQLTTLATRIATEFKAVRTEITNGLSAKANLSGASFTGDVSTSTKILVNASAGDEGGEIFLKKAVTNTTLTNGVTVDVYQNRLRFFEAGGTSRGYYVDVSAGAAAAGTNLLGAPGSTAITTVGTIGTGTWQGNYIGIPYGGTGASDAATARTNLGLAIGTNVQAYNATLASVAAGTYTGDDSITTVGTIGAGTWQGTDVGLAYGGTNATLTAVNGGVVYSNATAMAITTAGTQDQVLKSNGAAAPTWQTLDLTYMPDAAYKKSVKAATTANITLSAPQTIDGISVVAGDRVLVKNQTAAAQNGIYIVQAAAWTRATDADTISEIAGATVNVDSGTQGSQLWTNNLKTTDTLGTTAMTWTRIISTGDIGSSVQAYNATLAAVAGGTYTGDDSITTVGTIGTGTWQGTAVGVAYGGSGATTGAGLVPIIPTSVSVGSGTGSADTVGLVTFSGVSSVSLNGVFSSAYKNYRLVVSDINSASGNAVFMLRLRSGTTDNATSNYYQYWTMKRLNGTIQDNSGGPSTGYGLVHYDANTSYSWNWTGDIISPFATRNTTVTGLGFGADGTSSYNVNSTVLHNVASSFNGITFYPSTTSTMSGTVRIYGYR